MFKASIVLLSAFAALGFTYSASAIESQQWECAVNLHQGDNGTLSLDRTGDEVNGLLSIKRNTSVFENEVHGHWSGNEISLKRLLDSSSNDSMTGIAISLGTKKVNIGGRFSADYQGVWSADCDLIYSSSEAVSKGTSNITEPSTTSQVTPSNPTNKDRIKFFARATHPDDIESVSFFIDDKKAHTCETNTCEFSSGRFSKGNHTWYVQAVSKSGIKNKVSKNKLTVRTTQPKGGCSISGQATGPSAGLSSIYLINLFGPNNSNASTTFKDNQYKFSGLPEGQYTIKIDTRGDQAVIASPLSKEIQCKGNVTIDFDLY